MTEKYRSKVFTCYDASFFICVSQFKLHLDIIFFCLSHAMLTCHRTNIFGTKEVDARKRACHDSIWLLLQLCSGIILVSTSSFIVSINSSAIVF